MYVSVSVTIENCVIIPVFIMIFMSLISIAGFYHDKIIIKGAVELTAVKLEQLQEEEKSTSIKNMKIELTQYISEKTLFMKNVLVDIQKKNNIYVVTCNSRYGMTGIKAIMGKQDTCVEIRENAPCTIIRRMEAAMEVVGE